jgi:lipid A oxidase
MRRLAILCCLGCLGVATACATPRGEIALSAYGGRAWNSDADLHLAQPGGTDLRLLGVALDDESFRSPPFYGLRAAYWFPPSGAATKEEARNGAWGIALGYTHAKAVVDQTQVVRQSGTRQGTPVNGNFPVSDSIDAYQLSHGHNFLTLNGMYRWILEQRDRTILGRLHPYLGAGAGLVFPHVEATVNGSVTNEFQIAGPALQAYFGLDFDIVGPLNAFAEYKLNWADVTSELNGGGSIQSEIWTHQLIVGLTLRF